MVEKSFVFNRMRRHTRKSHRGGKLTHEQRYLVRGYNEIVDIESNPDHPLNQVIFDYIIKQRPSRPDLASNPDGYLKSIYGDEKTEFQAFLQNLDAPSPFSYNSRNKRNFAVNSARSARFLAYLKNHPQPNQPKPKQSKPVLNDPVYNDLPNYLKNDPNIAYLMGKPNKSTIKKIVKIKQKEVGFNILLKDLERLLRRSAVAQEMHCAILSHIFRHNVKYLASNTCVFDVKT